jgi:hypothetical protein
MLNRNNANRALRARHVAKLADDMSSGRWEKNGETIIFDEDGNLIDGQHRLNAIVVSGTEQEMLVVRGVEGSSIHTIDQGASRGIHDALSIKGVRNATLVTATYRLVSAYLSRGYASRVRMSKARSASEAIDFIENNQIILDSVSIYRNKAGGKSLIPASIWTAMYALLKDNHREKLELFFNRVNLGIEVPRSCPSYFLREIYIEKRMDKKIGGSSNVFYDVVHYWNEFVNDNRLRKPLGDGPTKLKLFGVRKYD